MGGAKSGNPTGVRPHGKHIQITFHWNRERLAPTYPHEPTPANLKKAEALRKKILAHIAAGVFTQEKFSEYFPGSRLALPCVKPQFQDLAQKWLNSLDVSANTREEYRKTLEKYWMPPLALTPIDEPRPSDIKALVNGITWTSAKTRNNALIPLRGVFQMAFYDELIQRDPTALIKNLKHQKPPVDPFSQTEAEAIITHLYEVDATYGAYFEAAFFSGLRTSEFLALQWEDIDWNKGKIRVAKARSKGRLADRTKTATIRDVDMNERSRHALTAMKAITFLQGGHIFRAPQSGEPWATDKGPRKVFTTALKRLGIRHRPAYNTRHTYATMLLMAGVNPKFVADQLGHSVIMTLTVYGAWIHGDQNKTEMSKVDFTRKAV